MPTTVIPHLLYDQYAGSNYLYILFVVTVARKYNVHESIISLSLSALCPVMGATFIDIKFMGWYCQFIWYLWLLKQCTSSGLAFLCVIQIIHSLSFLKPYW
jgi:hypothetical protein